MCQIPKEIWICILSNLNLQELILIEKVNSQIQEIVRTTPWNHIIVFLNKLNVIQYVIRNYRFAKYNLRDVTDDEVKLLTKCHTLDLSFCSKITDAS